MHQESLRAPASIHYHELLHILMHAYIFPEGLELPARSEDLWLSSRCTAADCNTRRGSIDTNTRSEDLNAVLDYVEAHMSSRSLRTRAPMMFCEDVLGESWAQTRCPPMRSNS